MFSAFPFTTRPWLPSPSHALPSTFTVYAFNSAPPRSFVPGGIEGRRLFFSWFRFSGRSFSRRPLMVRNLFLSRPIGLPFTFLLRVASSEFFFVSVLAPLYSSLSPPPVCCCPFTALLFFKGGHFYVGYCRGTVFRFSVSLPSSPQGLIRTAFARPLPPFCLDMPFLALLLSFSRCDPAMVGRIPPLSLGRHCLLRFHRGTFLYSLSRAVSAVPLLLPPFRANTSVTPSSLRCVHAHSAVSSFLCTLTCPWSPFCPSRDLVTLFISPGSRRLPLACTFVPAAHRDGLWVPAFEVLTKHLREARFWARRVGVFYLLVSVFVLTKLRCSTLFISVDFWSRLHLGPRR